MSDHSDPVWDCTFHYSIRPKIYTKNVTDVPAIELRRNTDGYLEGFDIAINNTNIPGAEKQSEKLADDLRNILIIKSGMTIESWSRGFQCKNKVTGRWHTGGTSKFRYGIEGGIDKLDLSDPVIQIIFTSSNNPKLEYLSNAVSHLYEGRVGESIKAAFRIIEKDTKSTKDYWKYNCIRNILTHDKVDSHVAIAFSKNFDPDVYNVFDFKRYDPHLGIINFDFESEKTRQTLNNLASDLINECRRILSL